MSSENKPKFTILRQGDVVVIPLKNEDVFRYFDRLFSVGSVVDNDDLIGARSSAYGKVVIRGEFHDHVLNGFYKFVNLGEDVYIVKCESNCILNHPEHGALRLDKGLYLVFRIFDWHRRIARFGLRRGGD